MTLWWEVGVISEFGPHRLCYKPTSKTGQTLEKQIFEIDGNPVPFKFHPLTLGSSRTKKARQRAQLTGKHASQLCLATIDEHSCEVTKIIFPNGTVNYVFHARKNSTCQCLRNLHHYLMQEGKAAELESFIGSLTKSRFLTDDLGGGRYPLSRNSRFKTLALVETAGNPHWGAAEGPRPRATRDRPQLPRDEGCGVSRKGRVLRYNDRASEARRKGLR